MNTHFDIEIPGHAILAKLGQGGMASVYLAQDHAFERLVAVKVIDAKFDRNSDLIRRFEREAKTAGGLSHPNIVPVHHFGFVGDGRPYLTMTYLQGGSLKDRLSRRGPFSLDEALSVARQVASALGAAHAKQIVHRDLKPDNVLFQQETAFLADFGIAKLLDASTELTGTGISPGTVAYFSPEQANEQPVDARSDIYTLGAVLFEMLTGRRPIEGDTRATLVMRIAYHQPANLPQQMRGLQPFMDVLLAKKPEERIGSCQDVVSVIDAMMRNWLKFENIDRLTDGVELRPSQRAPAQVDLDDPTIVLPYGQDQFASPTLSLGATSPDAEYVSPLVRESAESREPDPDFDSLDDEAKAVFSVPESTYIETGGRSFDDAAPGLESTGTQSTQASSSGASKVLAAGMLFLLASPVLFFWASTFGSDVVSFLSSFLGLKR